MTDRSISTPTCTRCELRADCVFADLDEAILRDLEACAHWLDYSPRQVVVREGDRAFGLFVIYRGYVKLYKRSLDGRRRILHVLGPADLFGEEMLVHGDVYATTAETLTGVDLLMLSREDRWVLHSPSVHERLFARLVHRLGRAESLLLETQHGSAEKRLLRVLIRLAYEHGRPSSESGWKQIDIGLTQTELGELAGLTREAVNRQLGHLRKEDLVAVDDQGLYVDLDRAEARLT